MDGCFELMHKAETQIPMLICMSVLCMNVFVLKQFLNLGSVEFAPAG